MMKLQTTNHRYYCHNSNYYADNLETFDTWAEFRDAWLDDELRIDHDYNHCFRFDITPMVDFENDVVHGDRFSLYLYMMLQRKGIFVPIRIIDITDADMPEIERYLADCWDYMRGQWVELDQPPSYLKGSIAPD